jgi:hypothetical protein
MCLRVGRMAPIKCDGPGQNNPDPSEGPWVVDTLPTMAVHDRVLDLAQYGKIVAPPRCTTGGSKSDAGWCMPGAGLSRRHSGKAPSERPTFQPYWGKPAVRNDGGDRGDVGIIRSPVRASILPDCPLLQCPLCPIVTSAPVIVSRITEDNPQGHRSTLRGSAA